MTIINGTPVSWFPKGVSDCLDSTPVFPGAMSALTNLIPDPSTKNVFYCRPASSLLLNFATTGGAFSSAFSSAFDIGMGSSSAFVSALKVVGNRAYGMVASSAFPGFDRPFSFNLSNSTLDPLTGVTAANIPASPLATGAWTPPTMDVIGTKIIVTHPGFNGAGNGYFGVIDISNPAAPTWVSQNTATTALPAVPVAVKQFGARAWFLVNPTIGQPGAYYSDVLVPTTITNGTQILTFDDNIPLTALGQLPLNNQLGGVIQALIVFKGVSNLYQVTGDAASSNLTKNSLNVATGTLASNSICTTPKGLAFAAPDGIRVIDFNANVSDPIGISGTGITVPLNLTVVPSRIAAACNLSIIRITTQNGNASGNPTQEYWYDMARDLWTGPHTFPASLIQPYTNTFVMTPVGVLAKLFQSDVMQTAVSAYTENGTAMTFTFKTSLLPNTGRISSNYISETTIDAALVAGSVYTAAATDAQGAVLDFVSLSIAASATATWGAFTWGQATWGANVSAIATRKVNWAKPVVSDQLYFQFTGNCAQGVKLGKLYFRYSPLGYLVDAA